MGREMACAQGKLFIAKGPWNFDVFDVEGHGLNLNRDCLHYGFFEKPEIEARFVFVPRWMTHNVEYVGHLQTAVMILRLLRQSNKLRPEGQ
jgi:hypothetical protein